MSGQGTLVFADPQVAAQLGFAQQGFADSQAVADDATPAPTTSQDTPVPTMRPDLEVTDVSPGLEGFLAIFAVVLAAIVLMVSLTRKLRKVNHAAGADHEASAEFDDRESGSPTARREA
jgi:hypothetical protein